MPGVTSEQDRARERLIDFLPQIYQSLAPELFQLPLAEERRATCEQCAMCPPSEGTAPVIGEYFSPSIKCCTYHPPLANYAVGGLLLDETSEGLEGRRRIREQVSRRLGVTPLGLLPPLKQRVLRRLGTRGFGRAETMTCPFLDRERVTCTVWRFRDAECTTWFCKHNDGEDGMRFWKELRAYLFDLQQLLASYALRELGWDADRIPTEFPGPTGELDARDLDDAAPEPSTYAELWREWSGREEELYIRAHELVRGLDLRSLMEIGGMRHRLALERLESRYRDLRRPAVPDPLLRNPGLAAFPSAGGDYVVVGYSKFDPMRMRGALFDLLVNFDGVRSNVEVRAAILGQTGMRVPDSLLTKLYQHRILIEARLYAAADALPARWS